LRRGGLSCPSNCTCDQLSYCGKPYLASPPPTPPADMEHEIPLFLAIAACGLVVGLGMVAIRQHRHRVNRPESRADREVEEGLLNPEEHPEVTWAVYRTIAIPTLSEPNPHPNPNWSYLTSPLKCRPAAGASRKAPKDTLSLSLKAPVPPTQQDCPRTSSPSLIEPAGPAYRHWAVSRSRFQKCPGFASSTGEARVGPPIITGASEAVSRFRALTNVLGRCITATCEPSTGHEGCS